MSAVNYKGYFTAVVKINDLQSILNVLIRIGYQKSGHTIKDNALIYNENTLFGFLFNYDFWKKSITDIKMLFRTVSDGSWQNR